MAHTTSSSSSTSQTQTLPTQKAFVPLDVNTIFKQFPSSDPMDQPDFSAFDWINEQFPDEDSLGKIDEVMETIKERIAKVDNEIVAAVSAQVKAGVQGQEELHKSNEVISTLFNRVKEIKQKAIDSERMVQEICKDIKGLDTAKQNLTTTITTFTRLHNIITQNEQLKLMIKNEQYKEIKNLLESVSKLLASFKDYKQVPKVMELQKEYDELRDTVKSQIFNTFKDMDAKSLKPTEVQIRNSACSVIDALGPEVITEFVQAFSNRYLVKYNSTFNSSNPKSGLDSAEERYSWLIQLLRFYDEFCIPIFPRHWKVSAKLAEDICVKTKEALVSQMRARLNQLDAALIKQLITKAVVLETELCLKFPDEEDLVDELSNLMSGIAEISLKPGKNKNLPPSKFRNLISGGFDEFLFVYTNNQDAMMKQTYEQVIGEEQWLNDPSKKKSTKIYDTKGVEAEMLIWSLESLGDLRYHFNTTRNKCVELNNGTALFEIFKLFKRTLLNYSAALKEKLDYDPTKTRPITDEVFNTVCAIANTCDACCLMCIELVNTIKDEIQPQFKEKIEMKTVFETFETLRSSALIALVKAVDRKTLVYFKEFLTIIWKDWDSVDQPKYITNLRDDLLGSMTTISRYLIPTQFPFLCNSVANQIVKNFDEYLSQIRGISNGGAEQILLDLSTLKSALIRFPSLCPDSNMLTSTTTATTTTATTKSQPKPYQKVLEDLFVPIEKQLQILMTSPEALVHSYKTMAYQASPLHFVKMMDIKGIPKGEQEAYLDKYGGIGPNDQIRIIVRNQLAEEGEFGKKISTFLKMKS